MPYSRSLQFIAIGSNNSLQHYLQLPRQGSNLNVCQQRNGYKEDVVCINTMEYYSAIERKEIVLFTETWMDLESVILSQVSQSEKDKYDITYMWNLKKKKKGINELIYTTEGEPQL